MSVLWQSALSWMLAALALAPLLYEAKSAPSCVAIGTTYSLFAYSPFTWLSAVLPCCYANTWESYKPWVAQSRQWDTSLFPHSSQCCSWLLNDLDKCLWYQEYANRFKKPRSPQLPVTLMFVSTVYSLFTPVDLGILDRLLICDVILTAEISKTKMNTIQRQMKLYTLGAYNLNTMSKTCK